jgi:hypothetical protein
MSPAGLARIAARGFVRGLRRDIAAFFSISGIVALVFGVLYRLDYRQVPHLLQSHGQAVWRSDVCLAAGVGCLVVGWLIRPRRRSLMGATG